MMFSILSKGLFLFLFLLLMGCMPKQEEIKYGLDACAFCKMSIVDPKFGAELVTKKGRVYKFDAIECMVNYDHQMQKPVSLYLVNVISKPGVLVPAEECQYVFSKTLPSPMGANLSAHLKTDGLPAKLQEENPKQMAWDVMREELVKSERY